MRTTFLSSAVVALALLTTSDVVARPMSGRFGIGAQMFGYMAPGAPTPDAPHALGLRSPCTSATPLPDEQSSETGSASSTLGCSSFKTQAALSARYWVSNLGLQAFVGMEIGKQNEAISSKRYSEYLFGIHMLYNFSRTRAVNLAIGAGLSTAIRSGSNDDMNALFLDVLISPEFHLNDHLALSATAMVSFELGISSQQHLRLTPFGFSVHYYF